MSRVYNEQLYERLQKKKYAEQLYLLIEIKVRRESAGNPVYVELYNYHFLIITIFFSICLDETSLCIQMSLEHCAHAGIWALES